MKASFNKEFNEWSAFAQIAIFVIPTRPPTIAGFDPSSEDGNEITIKFQLGNKENVQLYISFIQWIKSNSRIGSVHEMKEDVER